MNATSPREPAGPATTGDARDLTRFIQVYDHALEDGFCDRLVESFGQLANFHSRNGRGYLKQLEASAWTELNVSKAGDASIEDFFRAQVGQFLARYNEQLGMTLPVPFRPRLENLRIKRYLAAQDDQFQPHFDSLDYTANRFLVFLWYLNDVADGGETEFCDLGVRVPARKGRLLMFPPYWMFQHAGLAPRSDDKYIISTYMLF